MPSSARFSPSSSDHRRGLGWALSSAVGGAVMVVPWKLANEVGDPSHSVLLLLAVAALANSVLVVGQRLFVAGPELRIGGTEIWAGVLLAVLTLLGNHVSAVAIQDLSPALLSVLLRADVIFVAVFAWLFLGERIERRFWFGAMIAGIGLVVLQGPMGDAGVLGFFGGGTGLAVVAAIAFSLMAIVTRRFIHRIDPVAVNAIRLWLAVAFWFPFNEFPHFSEIPRDQILFATIAAIAGPFLGRIALMMSARHVEARVSTLASLAAPVLTLVLAFWVLSDWPGYHELIGSAIMIAGISVSLVRGPPARLSPGRGRRA
ncbi:MAG: DMT family transporter [bacterium]|nr:hypothetical protein [Deltaproteobacteria bacterium]MCP4903978.1 DMT family transporter [bacterium]